MISGENMEAKFREYYKKYYKDVVKLVYSYTLNIQDAEDIAQVVFIKLFNYMKKNNKLCEYAKPWLLRCAINESKNLMSSYCRKFIYSLDNYEYSISIKNEVTSIDMVDSLKKIASKYRIPLYLYYYEGYNIKEISNILSVKESTIKTRLKRGKEKLLKEMEG